MHCDDDNNPPAARDHGQLLAEIGVAPSDPFEFIVVRVGRTDNEFEITETATSRLRRIAVMALLERRPASRRSGAEPQLRGQPARHERARSRTRQSIALSAIFDVALGGFSECTGLEMSMQPEEYKEGGSNGAVLKFPTRVTWSNITLKKGIGVGNALWDWHYGFVEGNGKRRDGVIVCVDAAQRAAMRVPNNIWFFRRGLPVKYTGPRSTRRRATSRSKRSRSHTRASHQVPGVGERGGSRRRDRGIGGSSSMEVEIGQLTSTVHAVDGDALLSPRTLEELMQAIVRAVTDATKDDQRGATCRAERRITARRRRTETKSEEVRQRDGAAAAKAILLVDWPTATGRWTFIDVQYNPTEFSLDKSAQIAEIAIPGWIRRCSNSFADRPRNSRVELVLRHDRAREWDGRDQRHDARPIGSISSSRSSPKRHAPPICTFIWGDKPPGSTIGGVAGEVAAMVGGGPVGAFIGALAETAESAVETIKGALGGNQSRNGFRCIVESVKQKFTLFSPEGRPAARDAHPSRCASTRHSTSSSLTSI